MLLMFSADKVAEVKELECTKMGLLFPLTTEREYFYGMPDAQM